jgi:hypothetical protein
MINALPTATINYSPGTFCATGTATVSQTGQGGGTYTSASGLSINSSSGAINLGLSSAGTYTVTYSFNNGTCSNTTQASVTINALPTATISYGGPYCATGTATVTQSGTTGGTYSSAGGLSINASTGAINLGSSTAGTYTVTYSFNNGTCSNTTQASVTINALPAATISYSGSPYCAAGTATVTMTGQTGGTYSSAGGLSINASTGTINLGSSTAGTYTVTYSFSNGTCSNTTTTSVMINSLPMATISYSGSPYCATGTATVTRSGQAGGTYSSTGGLSINASTGAINLGSSTAGTYTVTYSFSNGTCSNTATTGVTINALPIATISYSGSPYCATGTATVTQSGTTGGTYSSAGGLSINASTGAINLGSSTAGTYTVTYSFSNGTCSNTTTTSVMINSLPMATISYSGSPYCATGTATVTQSGTSGGTYSSTTGLSINSSTGAINLGSSTAGTYTVTYGFSNGTCTNTTTTSVIINTLPTVIWSNALTAQCVGSTTYGLTGGSPTGGTYSGTGVSGTNFDAAVAGVGTFTLTYTYTNGSGCTNITTNTIIVYAQQSINGIVTYWNNNTPLGDVTVNLYDVNTHLLDYTTTTSNSEVIGTYFFNVCQGSYVVTCSTIKNPGGINSTDAAQVNAWYVNQYPIEKVRAFAGDVVTDDYLNSADAGKIVQYFITNGDSTWKKRGTWTFWRTNDMIINDAQLNTYHFPETDTIIVNGSSRTFNIYGLSTGDFNGSFIPGSAKEASNSLSLTYGATLQATTGEEFDLPLYTQSDINVGAVSLILNYPSDKLQIMGVNLADDANTPMKYNISDNEIRIGWFSGEDLSLKAGAKLLTLRVKLIGSLEQNEILRFTLAGDQLNELANAFGIVIPDAVLNMDLIGTTLGINPGSGTESLRLTNYPNPFTGTTTLAYSLPINGDVTIELRNTLGVLDRVVMDNVPQTSGDYKLVLDASDLSNGVYIVTLKLISDGEVMTQTIKIVRTY